MKMHRFARFWWLLGIANDRNIYNGHYTSPQTLVMHR
jgi:hypothetical protein